MKELKGIITAMVTPFDETEKWIFRQRKIWRVG